MLDIILLEIIAISAFLFSLFMVFFHLPSPEQFIFFAWTVLVSAVLGKLRQRSSYFDLGFLLLLLPLLLYKTIPPAFVLIIAGFMYIYAWKSLLKGGHHDYINNLKKTILVYFIVIYVRSLLEALAGGSPGQASPFIVLYLLTSVLLIRSVRHLESSLGVAKIRKDNLRYIAVMLAVFAISTLGQVREFFRLLGHRFLNLVALPFYLVAKFVEFLIQIIARPESQGRAQDPIKLPDIVPPEQIKDIVDGEAELINLGVSDRIIMVFFFVLLLIILYRIIIKTGEREGGISFTEAREYITERPIKKRPRKDRFPTELREQVRYFYRRYLDVIRGYKIPMSEAYTTQEINERVEFAFGDEIEGFREIYIESRYGEKDVTPETVATMQKLYKKITD